MSGTNGSNGYSVRLVYYGRADLMKKQGGETTYLPQHPQAATQNVRIIPFSSPDPESFDYIGIYELVKNLEAPKSDLEGTKLV